MLKMLCVKMVMFQKMGGMFQEALAMPGPVLSQASPAPSQAIIETTVIKMAKGLRTSHNAPIVMLYMTTRKLVL